MPVQLTDLQIQEYLDAFDKFDADGDGYVTRDEVFNVLERIGLFTTPDKMVAVLKANALNHDKIGQMEFLRLAKAFLEKRQAGTKMTTTTSSSALATTTAKTIMKMSNWLQGGDDGADPQAMTTTSFFSKTAPMAAAGLSFSNSKIGASPESLEEVVVIVEGADNDSDFEYYSYSESEDDDSVSEKQQLLSHDNQQLINSNKPVAGDQQHRRASVTANGAGERPRSPSVSKTAGNPKRVSTQYAVMDSPLPQEQYQMQSVAREPMQAGSVQRERRRQKPAGGGGSVRGADRHRGRRLNEDGKPIRQSAGTKAEPGQAPRRKGPSALHDPKVRSQLARMKVHPPAFIFFITVVHICVFLYEIYVNAGLEDFGTNPFFGPTGLTLIQTGSKYVPCMRPDNDIKGDFYMACNDKYPNDYPKAKNGSCLYYDNLAFICGMGGFTQRDKPDQIWRFITPIFVHSGFLHLMFNMLIQLRTGLPIERNMGSFRMAIIYLISGVTGNVLASVLAPKSVSAGASGALYGLFALLYIDLFSNWPLLTTPKKDLAKLTVNVMIALAVGLLPLVDNYAHIGGFVGGMLSGMIFMPKIAFSKWDRRRKRILAIASVPLLLIGLIVGFYLFWVGEKNVCSWCIYLDCVPPSAAWCQSN